MQFPSRVGLAAIIGAFAFTFIGCGKMASVGVCPDGMIYISAGRFPYGEKTPTKDRRKEHIAAFCIDKYEYPNKQGVRPVSGVTWMEAASKCRSVGKRLCTEYEWEKACRGKAGWRYSYGRGYDMSACPGATGDGAEYLSGTNGECISLYGVHDMSGSVWEWTQNAYDGDTKLRVTRGGWDPERGATSSRCSFRRAEIAAKPAASVGFRCCSAPTVSALPGAEYGQ